MDKKMSALISLLLVWFVISIPVAFFVGAVFTLSKKSDEVEVGLVNKASEVAHDQS